MNRLRLAALLVVAAGTTATAQAATPSMLGRWRGDAEIFVNWTKARTLPIDLTISSDDQVTGMIGSARLVSAKLERNRGSIGRLLNVKTDYRIAGGLDGPIIAAEDITRARVSLALTWIEGRFEGSLATSGSAFGGAESMVLTAGKLVLHRVPDRIVCQRSSPNDC